MELQLFSRWAELRTFEFETRFTTSRKVSNACYPEFRTFDFETSFTTLCIVSNIYCWSLVHALFGHNERTCLWIGYGILFMCSEFSNQLVLSFTTLCKVSNVCCSEFRTFDFETSFTTLCIVSNIYCWSLAHALFGHSERTCLWIGYGILFMCSDFLNQLVLIVSMMRLSAGNKTLIYPSRITEVSKQISRHCA